MTLNGDENSWKICHRSQPYLEAYRSQIVLHILYNAGTSLHNPIFMYDVDYTQIPWTWAQQGQWQGLCMHGEAQSPIAINTETVKESPNFRLNLSYSNDTDVDSIVSWTGHE